MVDGCEDVATWTAQQKIDAFFQSGEEVTSELSHFLISLTIITTIPATSNMPPPRLFPVVTNDMPAGKSSIAIPNNPPCSTLFVNFPS